MTEYLLQYLWNYKIFSHFDFKDVEGNSMEVLEFGKWNLNAGPDFLHAKIRIEDLILVGNIEIHIKSSDWILHQHSENSNYENVILHVVFLHDVDVPDLIRRNIPTLELKNHLSSEILKKYEFLSSKNNFIPCEKIFDAEKIPSGFTEETLLKKLDEKSEQIEFELKENKNNYEAVLFHHLAYSFGLKINAEIFKEIAESIDFNIIRKISNNVHQLEALLLGKAGWLEKPLDKQMGIWKKEFEFIKNKFQISDLKLRPKFLRLRPQNFPTLRMSQLANLYHQEKNLFSRLVKTENTREIQRIFESIKASEYWDHHFNFGKISTEMYEKKLSEDFINRVILNTILPLKYAYHKHHQEEIADKILELYEQVTAEKNSIITEWKKLGTNMKSSAESQSLLYHHKNFCILKKCLNCSIGFQLLK